ncbi:hypothetical protein IKS57_00695 [bacterium]|nr:hypothetical protein [bacterium]
MNNYFYFFTSFCNLDFYIEQKINELSNYKEIDKYQFDNTNLLTKDKIIEIENILINKQTKKQFVIIKNFELLNKEIINSLLLILEEQKQEIYFIFASNNEDRILKTITSRCICFHLEFAEKEFQNIINKFKIKDEILIKLFQYHFFSKKDIESFVSNNLAEFNELLNIIKNNQFEKINTLFDFFKNSDFNLMQYYLFY